MKNQRQATAKDVERWPKLVCQGCTAEASGDELDAPRLRQTLRKAGWKHDHRTGRDFCPVCVKMGLGADPEFNPPPATT